MNYFRDILINLIFLMFPLLLYILCTAHQKNLSQKEDNLFLSIALMTGLYLVMEGGFYEKNCIFLFLLADVPLFISYVKGKWKTGIFLSVILIIYQAYFLQVPIWFAVIEYMCYLFLHLLLQRGKRKLHVDIHLLILLKAFFFTMKSFYLQPISPYVINNFAHVFLDLFLFYIVCILVFFLLQKGEEIIDLNQTLKALEKEKTLRVALFKITHEIKNPIAVCKGYLDMLDLNNQEKVAQYIPIVEREIERTLTLLDDYSSYTKIKVEKDVMDLCFLLEEMKDQLETLFLGSKIKCSFSIPDEEIDIIGDYNRLKQVLVNLFKNAMEAKEDRRPLKISLTVVKKKKTVEIVVQDNGIGMDKETLNHVSDMFYTTKVNGTGLGVALSNEIIALHHGKISYHSILGQGTTVTISLPLFETEKETK